MSLVDCACFSSFPGFVVVVKVVAVEDVVVSAVADRLDSATSRTPLRLSAQ